MSSTSIEQCNKSSIQDFYNFSVSRGLSAGRLKVLLQEMSIWAELVGKDFKKASKEDIQAAVARMNPKLEGATREKKVTILKQFYKHLLGDDEDYPIQVKWTRTIKYNKTEKKSSDMITQEDLKLLLKACIRTRDAVLLYFLWETGIRVGELSNIKIGDLKDEGTHYVVEVDGKTGRRNVPVVESVDFLKKWLNEHPTINDKSAPLFYNQNRGKVAPLDTRSLNYIFKRIAKRAGFDKPVNPHNFRHSSATVKSESLPQAILCDYYGWRQGSRMPQTYQHISNKQTERAVLKHYGINNETEPEPIKMTECFNCRTKNLPSNFVCSNCGRALDPNKVIEVKNTMADMQAQIKAMQSLLRMPDESKARKRQIRRAIRRIRLREITKQWAEKHGQVQKR
jgi:integrase